MRTLRLRPEPRAGAVSGVLGRTVYARPAPHARSASGRCLTARPRCRHGGQQELLGVRQRRPVRGREGAALCGWVSVRGCVSRGSPDEADRGACLRYYWFFDPDHQTLKVQPPGCETSTPTQRGPRAQTTACLPGMCLEGNMCSGHRAAWHENPLCAACDDMASNWFGRCLQCEESQPWMVVAGAVLLCKRHRRQHTAPCVPPADGWRLAVVFLLWYRLSSGPASSIAGWSRVRPRTRVRTRASTY
jgi:hypothetical protein